jgi:uncharacterized protein Yka (UPF0111/DUF47 family)
MLTKEKAVASLGQTHLLLPAWIKSALAANDRLKLYLSLLQSAVQHAQKPEQAPADWSQELAAQGLKGEVWLRDLVRASYLDEKTLVFPQHDLLVKALAQDIALMARPILDSQYQAPPALHLAQRLQSWQAMLSTFENGDGLTLQAITTLSHGNPKLGDSLHLLVMDLHKQLNVLSSQMATENLDGAHVWQIESTDAPLVRAFMRGLNRTAPLKFQHPGLDTAVTRDGDKLLIQNDIGTNDAHVLVLEVKGMTLSLTYSDLHAPRFEFFCRSLERLGFVWKSLNPVSTEGLNDNKPYHMARGELIANDQETLLKRLDGLGSRIVFVIDWNRARKCLKAFVSKRSAIDILEQAAEHEYGHMAWLIAGAEQLIYGAMQAVGSDIFRVGDRLGEVMGDAVATDYLLGVMRVASRAMLQQQPLGVVADEARLLLWQALQRRTFEFDFLAEHAAYCHALAQGVIDALEESDAERCRRQTDRAKAWERKADHVLMDARQRAIRQPRWKNMVVLLESADDVADAIEEASFIHSMTHQQPLQGLPVPVRAVLLQLAGTTLGAIQDWVRAIEMARHLKEQSDASDNEDFLQSLWRMLRAERRCDALLREARVVVLEHLHQHAAALMLANDLANALEAASDSLLRSGYALRELVLEGHGVTA